MNSRPIAALFVATFLLAIAHSAWAADAPKPVDAPKSPAHPAAAKPIVPGPEASGLEVTIKSAKVDYVALKKPLPGGGFDDQISGQKLLMITVTIANKGQKEITYKSFNGTVEGKDDRASLTTTAKKLLPIINFGELELADAIKQATLKPGESVTDALCFMAPPEKIIPETLTLPAKNHGDNGYWKLAVKVEEVK